MISKLIDSLEIGHLLDYLCGESHPLARQLSPNKSFKYQAFDYLVDELSGEPEPAEMVVCIDRLSTLGLAQITDAMDELERLTQEALFITVKTDRHPLNYWLHVVMERFNIQRVQVIEDSACIVAFSMHLDSH